MPIATKIKLISIVSKNSLLYKAVDIKLLLPEVEEAGYGIVPHPALVAIIYW